MPESRPPKAIWIAWEHQIRNRSLSARLGAELHVFVHRGARVARYLMCILRTIAAIRTRRPVLIFAQNPSLVLNYLLLLLRPLFGFRLVTDAHYAGVTAINGSPLLQRILDFGNRHADLVIVTNERHREHVETIGGVALVCQDPLPELSGFMTATLTDRKVFFICSFDVDEPYAAAFRAATVLKADGFTIWVSGNFRKVGLSPSDYPDVRLLGFVPEPEFYAHLASAEVVVDLTSQDDCLVCGGYEAMALDKPLVTSDRPALRRYFSSGTIFVGDGPEDIAEGIRAAYRDRLALRQAIREWKVDAVRENDRRIAAISEALKMRR